MVASKLHAHIFNTIRALLVLYTCSFFGKNGLVDATISSTVEVCAKRGEDIYDSETCQLRLHTELTVFHGKKQFNYIFRSKEDPSKGLYITIETSFTNVAYELNYIKSVPYLYKEHNVAKSYEEVGENYEDACPTLKHDKCSNEDIPQQFRKDFFEGICCICGLNVDSSSPRDNFKCEDHDNSNGEAVISKACLEVVEPWYKMYKPSYPPKEYRSIMINIYKFDSESGVIPDAKNPETAKKQQTPVPKGEQKTTQNNIIPQVQKLGENFVRVTLTKSASTYTDENFNISVDYQTSGSKHGTPPPLLDKYIFAPYYPKDNETVKGSSLKDKCIDATWSESMKRGPKGITPLMAMHTRCTNNLIAVDRSAIDTTGVSCNKIGLSIGTWSDYRRLCTSPKGTCIQNQLGWYHKEYGSKSRVPKLFGVSPILTTKVIKEETLPSSTFATTWENENIVHQLSYTHANDDVSKVKLDTFDATVMQIISDAPGFLLEAKANNKFELGTDKDPTIFIKTKNMGRTKALFTHRVHCYCKGHEELYNNAIAHSNEHTTEINPNKIASFPVRLIFGGTNLCANPYCKIELLSGLKTLLDTLRLPIFINGPELTLGPDPRSIDDEVSTRYYEISAKGSGRKKSEEKEEACPCNRFNFLCIIFNFNTCFNYYFQKVYMYIIIGLGILLAIVLLPILLPFLVKVISGLFWLCKLPYERWYRKKQMQSNRIIDVDPGHVHQQ